MTIAWTAPANNGDPITRYDTRKDAGAATDQNTALSATYSGFVPAESHGYSVRACNTVGCSAYSGSTSCASSSTAPNMPAQPTCGTETDVTVPFSWSAPTANGEAIDEYKIYRDGSAFVSLGGGVTSYTYTGLSPVTPYVLTVIACNSIGCSSASTGRTCTTVAGLPSVPSAPSCGATTSTSVAFSWSAPAANGAAINNYDVQRDSGNLVAKGTSMSHTYGGLSYVTGYDVRVRACNSVGCSAYSSATTCTTDPHTPAVPATPTCGVETSTTVPFSWTEPANNGAPVTKYIVELDGASTLDKNGATSHTFTGLAYATAYSVSVQACNVAGCSAFSSKTCTTEPSFPATPAQPSACTSVTPNSFSIAWTAPVDNGAPITNYRLDKDGVLWANTGTATSDSVTGLVPATTYQMKVRATNSAGDSAFSSPRSCTTAPDVPLTPAAPVCGVETWEAVPFSWTAPNAQGSAIIRYQVQIDGGSQVNVNSGTSHTYNGLDVVTPYDVRVRAVNGVGNGPWSAATTCTTTPAPPDAPTTPVCGSSTDTTVTISYTAPNDNGDPIIRFDTQVDSGSIDDQGMALTATHSGLAYVTAYQVRVRAVNPSGAGQWSTAATCTTLASEPEPPNMPTCSSVASTSLVLSWPAATDNGDPIVSYTVRKDNTVLSSPTVTTLTVTGLMPGTAYDFDVLSTNGIGSSGYSAVRTCTTDAIIPSVPGSPACGSPTTSSVELVWSAPYDGGSPIVSYEVEIDNGNQVSIAPLFYSYGSLAPGISYNLRVRATNSVGSSAFSGNVACLTDSTEPDVPAQPSPCSGETGFTVDLAWLAPLPNGEPISNYNIEIDGSEYGDVSTTSETITGLLPGVTYDFRVRADNSVGSSGYSAVRSCTTQSLPPQAPSAPVCTQNAYDRLTVSWSAPDPQGSPINDYDLLQDGSIDRPIGNVLTTVVTGLVASTAYDFVVRASNGIGTGPYSPSATGCTPLPETPLPVTPSCGTILADSVQLTWSAPNERGAAIDEYYIMRDGVLFATVPPSTSYTANGLDHSTPYDWEVIAHNSVGDSVGVVETCTTIANPPNMPAAPPTCNTIDEFTIDVDWAAGTVTSGPPVSLYDVFREVPGNAIVHSSNSLAFTDSSLLPATQHRYKYRAVNTAGVGPWSGTTSCTTDNAGIGSLVFTTQPVGGVYHGDVLPTQPVVEVRDACHRRDADGHEWRRLAPGHDDGHCRVWRCHVCRAVT